MDCSSYSAFPQVVLVEAEKTLEGENTTSATETSISTDNGKVTPFRQLKKKLHFLQGKAKRELGWPPVLNKQ